MPKRLIITVVCFHVSAVIFVLEGLLAFGLAAGNIGIWSVAVYIAACITSFEIVVMGLRKQRRWAWIIGIVLSGIIIVSGIGNVVGLVLGGLSLWGLVDSDTVKAFRPVQAEPTTED
ncbi:MAG: hypothetical protein ABFD83_03245 [Armatimonadota bacterium]